MKIISRGKGPPHILNPANGEDTVATSDTFAYSNMFEEHIMGATWFTRVWVLQELILSVNPLVQFGTRRMSWADFYTHAHNHRRTSRPELDSFNQIEIIKTKYYADSTNADLRASAIWLLDILDRRRGAGVSDPGDMIYAHLSLCNIALRNYVPVDHSISYEDLYTDLACKYSRMAGNLGIFILFNRSSGEGRQVLCHRGCQTGQFRHHYSVITSII
ncbi:hypothetical protein WAI453_011581 [Rhynchosporium graminicola]